MNDHEVIHQWSRAAADEIRRRADEIADPLTALAALHRAIDGVDRVGPAASGRRPGLWVLAAAAASIALVAATVLLFGRDDAIETVDTPPVTSPVTRAVTTAPVPTVTPSTVPTSSTPVPTAPTVAPTSEPGTSPTDTIVVADVVRDAGPRPVEELFRTAIGSGPGELGVEDCQECDPVTPWAPIHVGGRVVIADPLNAKWVVGTPGEPPVDVPFVDGFTPISAPVVTPDGTIWVVDGNGPAPDTDPDPALLRRYTVDALTVPIESHPVAAAPNSTLWVAGADVVVNATPVARWTDAAGPWPRVRWGLDDPVAEVVVDDGGPARTWRFEPGQVIARATPAPLADGSVLALDVTSQELIRLTSDGAALRFRRQATIAYDGTDTYDERFRITLERDGDELVVRRYLMPVPGESATVIARAFAASGSADDVCEAAMLHVQPSGYDFDAIVVAETTIERDGARRLLVCVGDGASGQGVVALVDDGAGGWLLADVGLGNIRHAGDRVTFGIDGGSATIGYQSEVWESNRAADAATLDGGLTWTVTHIASE